MSDSIDSYVSPICLPWKSEDPGYSVKAGQELTATGWGATTNDRSIVYEVMITLYHSGSLNSECNKVKAYITIKYWLKISKQGVSTCTGYGHL